MPCHRLPTATAALARLASSIPRSRGQAMPKMFYSSVPREELQIFWKTPRPGALGALAKDRWRVGAPGRRAASLTLCSSSEHTAQSPHPRCRPPISDGCAPGPYAYSGSCYSRGASSTRCRAWRCRQRCQERACNVLVVAVLPSNRNGLVRRQPASAAFANALLSPEPMLETFKQLLARGVRKRQARKIIHNRKVMKAAAVKKVQAAERRNRADAAAPSSGSLGATIPALTARP